MGTTQKVSNMTRKTVEIYNDLVENDIARVMFAEAIGELAVKYHEQDKEKIEEYDEDDPKEKSWDDISKEVLVILLNYPLDRDG